MTIHEADEFAEMFNLWNFFQISETQFTFDVTQANAPSLANGSLDWIEGCLRKFGSPANLVE